MGICILGHFNTVPLRSHTPLAVRDGDGGGGSGDTQEKLSTVRCVSMKKTEEGSSYLSGRLVHI